MRKGTLEHWPDETLFSVMDSTLSGVDVTVREGERLSNQLRTLDEAAKVLTQLGRNTWDPQRQQILRTHDELELVKKEVWSRLEESIHRRDEHREFLDRCTAEATRRHIY